MRTNTDFDILQQNIILKPLIKITSIPSIQKPNYSGTQISRKLVLIDDLVRIWLHSIVLSMVMIHLIKIHCEDFTMFIIAAIVVIAGVATVTCIAWVAAVIAIVAIATAFATAKVVIYLLLPMLS